jgi:hypothetical protein
MNDRLNGTGKIIKQGKEFQDVFFYDDCMIEMKS